MIFENNVPIVRDNYNSEHGTNITEMLKFMQIGQSTIVETTNFNSFRANLSKRGKRINYKFTYKTLEPNKYRVWRIQ